MRRTLSNGLLATEALAWLAAAELALRAFSFGALARWASRPNLEQDGRRRNHRRAESCSENEASELDSGVSGKRHQALRGYRQGAVLAGRVGWAIAAAAARAPWRPACFAQALAAQAMLRRRGLAATLCYGARRDGAEGVRAHVWVRCQGREVVGGEAAGDFALLAAYPAGEGGEEGVRAWPTG